MMTPDSFSLQCFHSLYPVSISFLRPTNTVLFILVLLIIPVLPDDSQIFLKLFKAGPKVLDFCKKFLFGSGISSQRNQLLSLYF
jgi:hypothetical protein